MPARRPNVGSKPAILHVITGLGQGGAERQLANMVGFGRDDFRTAVFSIRPFGAMAEAIGPSGTSLFTGGASSPVDPRWLPGLRGTIRRWEPDVVVGWMYHGNLAASFCRLIGHDGPVVWNIRHSVNDLTKEKLGTRSVIRLGARVSGSATRVIYNSQTAAAQHKQLGFQDLGRIVVPNGFDIRRFAPNSIARRRLREAMGILDSELLLGVVGRSHAMKNHGAWVKAFAELVSRNESVHCLMMGAGVDDPRGPVAQAVSERGLSDFIHYHPTTGSPEKVYPAMDLLVLPSAFGEGISNVVGEAMACGVPAAVTDVGDSPVLVGDAGFVINGTQPAELAAGVEPATQLSHAELADLGRLARQRVIDHYSLEAIGKRYYSVLSETLQDDKT